MKRRDFIKGLGVVGVAALIPFPSLAKGHHLTLRGYVCGKTYYIDNPIIIDRDNTTIKYCKFIATRPMPIWIDVRGSVNNLKVISNSFEGG